MRRKLEAEYPQEILDIFKEHCHSRREFVVRAGKLTVGSLAAGSLFEALSTGPALAQTAARTVQRVAVIGAGHYHATAAPGYLKILQNLKLDIVGIHDFDPA